MSDDDKRRMAEQVLTEGFRENYPDTYAICAEYFAGLFLREHDPTLVWTDEQCFQLNAAQHRTDRHPYTCGNDSRHRRLIATRHGWRCADCDYRQGWAHTEGN